MEKDPNHEISFLENDDFLKSWSAEKLQQALDKIQQSKGNPLCLQVKTFALTMKDNKIYNKVELDSDFDFKTIEEILISLEEENPLRKNLYYTTVVLFGHDKKLPMIFPYCFYHNIEKKTDELNLLALDKKQRKKLKKKIKKNEEENENNLTHWVFINNKSEEAFHSINSFSLI